MLGDYLIQSGSKLLSFDQQHAHFLTTSQKNDFSCISPPTMGNKSNAARRNRNKHQGSPFESQNEPTAVASSSKRVKRSKQTDHIDDNEQDVSTAHPRAETMPKDPIDHTRQYFKIMCCVMLGNTVVDEDTKKVGLGEFIYRQFDVQGSSHQKHRQSYCQGSFRVRKALQ